MTSATRALLHSFRRLCETAETETTTITITTATDEDWFDTRCRELDGQFATVRRLEEAETVFVKVSIAAVPCQRPERPTPPGRRPRPWHCWQDIWTNSLHAADLPAMFATTRDRTALAAFDAASPIIWSFRREVCSEIEIYWSGECSSERVVGFESMDASPGEMSGVTKNLAFYVSSDAVIIGRRKPAATTAGGDVVLTTAIDPLKPIAYIDLSNITTKPAKCLNIETCGRRVVTNIKTSPRVEFDNVCVEDLRLLWWWTRMVRILYRRRGAVTVPALAGLAEDDAAPTAFHIVGASEATTAVAATFRTWRLAKSQGRKAR